jgi:hypothetical protein
MALPFVVQSLNGGGEGAAAALVTEGSVAVAQDVDLAAAGAPPGRQTVGQAPQVFAVLVSGTAALL